MTPLNISKTFCCYKKIEFAMQKFALKMYLKTLPLFCVGLYLNFSLLQEHGKVLGSEGIGFLLPGSFQGLDGGIAAHNVLVSVSAGIFLITFVCFLVYKMCIQRRRQKKKNTKEKRDINLQIKKQNINGQKTDKEPSFKGFVEESNLRPTWPTFHFPTLDSNPVIQRPSADRLLNNIEPSLGMIEINEPVMPSFQSLTLSPSPINQQPIVDPAQNSAEPTNNGTIEMDGIPFLSTLMGSIDSLSTRASSLELQSSQLRGGAPVQREELVEEAPPWPTFKPEDVEDKVPLPSVLRPVTRNRVQLVTPVHVVHPSAQPPSAKIEKDLDLVDYVFCVGVSVALGFAVYRILGNTWR